MPLKVLNCPLVFLGCRFSVERSQIPALSRFWIFVPRVQPILTGLELFDHTAWKFTFRLPLTDKISTRVGQTFARARVTLQ
jgi:hypothetical protein